MNFRLAVAAGIAFSAGLLPGLAFAQAVNVTRSVLPTQPYTLIYPDAMVAVGGGPDPLTINHPDAPLQCDLTVVPVEDTEWTPEKALSELDEATVTQSWSETFPGFILGNKTTTQYQNVSALLYEGTSTGSPQGVPLTIVHTETVSDGNGYALDCLFATEVAAQARPIVDFIIANFATRSDAECCIGATVADEPPQQ